MRRRPVDALSLVLPCSVDPLSVEYTVVLFLVAPAFLYGWGIASWAIWKWGVRGFILYLHLHSQPFLTYIILGVRVGREVAYSGSCR